jgi:lipoprotein-anchoring transpeptidase ErfK/SrfK
MGARRRIILGSGVLAVGLAVAGAWVVTSHGSAYRPSSQPTGGSSTTGARSEAAEPSVSHQLGVADQARANTAASQSAASQSSAVTTVPAESLVATIRPEGVPGSQTPGGQPTLEVPGAWLEAASVLPVIARQPGWVEVRLAQRPNGSIAWVPARAVSLATDSYHIVIDLRTMHLQLFNRGQEVANFPAGIGVPTDPTPTGSFFVALFAQAPSPGYGAFVMVTSAHSNSITDWEASGDAITAIHGSLGSDAAIGTTGAEVSHGCIRLHDADLVQLRDVPAGTPIDIVG